MSSLHVICKVGDSEYAVPADSVVQMEAFSGATPIPGAPKYVAGLVQIRGRVLPVLDVRIRFGLEPRPTTLESRIIVMKFGERIIGILVDSAREVQNIAAEMFTAPPGVVAVQSAGFIKSIAQLKDRIIMLMDSEKVIGEEIPHV